MGRIRSGAGRDDHSRRRAHDSPSTPALSRGAVARRSVPHMPTATTNANAKHGAISTRKQPCALLQYVTSLTSAEHNPQIPPRRPCDLLAGEVVAEPWERLGQVMICHSCRRCGYFDMGDPDLVSIGIGFLD